MEGNPRPVIRWLKDGHILLKAQATFNEADQLITVQHKTFGNHRYSSHLDEFLLSLCMSKQTKNWSFLRKINFLLLTIAIPSNQILFMKNREIYLKLLF